MKAPSLPTLFKLLKPLLLCFRYFQGSCILWQFKHSLGTIILSGISFIVTVSSCSTISSLSIGIYILPIPFVWLARNMSSALKFVVDRVVFGATKSTFLVAVVSSSIILYLTRIGSIVLPESSPSLSSGR